MMRKQRRKKKKNKHIPKEIEQMQQAIVKLTDEFSQKHLNEDYQVLAQEMTAEIWDLLLIESGRVVSWASGIIHALGWVNFLQDPASSPYMTSSQVAKAFGVSQQTMLTKSKIIRDFLDIIQLDPAWCIRAMIEDNPMIWMLKVNGFVMDIRTAPIEAQKEAYLQGLIPYIPAYEQDEEQESAEQPEVIKFPVKETKAPAQKSSRKKSCSTKNLFGEFD